jgi:hypothetical protein
MRSTALVSAKYMARSMVLHSALRVPVFWNETVSLLRPAWQPFFSPGQPDVQPDYSYYVLRTLSTVMDGMRPVENGIRADVEGTPPNSKVECRLFQNRRGQLLAALWRPGSGGDGMEAVALNLRIEGLSARRVTGIELFNGEEQEQTFERTTTDIHVHRLMVRDSPLLVLLNPAGGDR